MAAKTPVTAGTSGFTEKGVYVGAIAAGSSLLSGGTHYSNREGFELDIVYFSDIDDGDTWTSNIPNIQALAWQPDIANTDDVRPHLTTQATGVVTFQTGGDDRNGWLWVLRGR